MSKEFNDKKASVSDFNEASLQIIRLHNIWSKCSRLSSSGLLDEWKWNLDRAWVELAADAKEADGFKNKTLYEWLSEGVKNPKTYIYGITQINNEISSSKNRNEFYSSLQKKEIYLKCLQEDVGKGGKKSKQYEDIM